MRNSPALRPENCAVRRHAAGAGEALGRCWRPVSSGKCPVHGDVSGVQYRFRRTGELTNDFDLEHHRTKTRPLAAKKVTYGTESWLERFRIANPSAEFVGFRGRAPLVKITKADAAFPRIFQITGGTPERPTMEEY